MHTPTHTDIPGYVFGDADLAPSPVTLEDLDELMLSTAFTQGDVDALVMAGSVLADQIENILNVWYGFVGSHPHLLAYFSTPEGAPIPEYLARVRARFGQWILDSCLRPYDQDWLDFQNELGLRHTSAKKNQTDGARSVPQIPLRYVLAFIAPISLTMKPFLAAHGHTVDEVEVMHQAWLKSVVLQVALWSQPYVGDGW